MKLVWIAAPIVLLAVVVLLRALVGRPLSRFALNVTVALFLLVYLVATAALGLFWVARMDLPAFDLHYLFGYCVILLATVHVGFQLRILAAYFRKLSPRAWLAEDARSFRRPIRAALLAALGAVLVVPVAWVVTKQVGARGAEVVARESARVAPPADGSAPVGPPRIVVLSADGRRSAIDYMHEQSSYWRFKVARAPRFVVREPPPLVRRLPSARRVSLPRALPPAGRSLGASLRHRLASADTKRPPTSSRVGMPAELVVVEPPSSSLSAAELAVVLAYSTGPTNPERDLAFRAAASSGALHPNDLYVFLSEGHRELRPGAYYYDPADHALAEVGRAGATARLNAALGRRQPPEGTTFAIGATFDRTTWKYKTRSYRYIALDAGHVATNLTLVASALGYSCWFEPWFDDSAVEQALELDPELEGVVVLIRCARERNAASDGALRLEPVELPERADRVELTRLSHRLTSARRSSGVAPWTPSAKERTESDDSDRVRLPAVEDSDEDLFATIAGRRSYRAFAERSVSSAEMAGILRDAIGLAPSSWAGDPVDLFVIVRAVEGLQPGAYRYLEREHALVPGLAGDLSSRIQAAGLSQELLGRAAFVIVWAYRTASAGSFAGPRDYRLANLVAGIGGQNAYLSATARGLGICGVGAFYDDEVDEILDARQSGHRALYLMGVGHKR